MKSLVESILDDNFADRGSSKIKKLLDDYDQCLIFDTWHDIAIGLFSDAFNNAGEKTMKVWKTFLKNWVLNSDFHSFFSVDEGKMYNQPLSQKQININLEYINKLKPGMIPEMSLYSSGSSLAYFFDSDQIFACDEIKVKLAKALGKNYDRDFTKKIKEIKRKFNI